MAVCNFCSYSFGSATAVRRHQSNPDSSCYQKAKSAFKGRLAALKATHRRGPQQGGANLNASSSEALPSEAGTSSSLSDIAECTTAYPDAGSMENECTNLEAQGTGMEHPDDDVDAIPPKPRSPSVEDIEDIDSPQARRRIYSEQYPGAGKPKGNCKTSFELVNDEQVLTGADIWGPFKDDEEWELAKWLIKNVGHGQVDTFLKLPLISNRAKLSYTNKNQFLDKIDSLPGGVPWQCVDIEIEGDELEEGSQLTDAVPKFRKETVELWFRDPVECVRELIGNPNFRNVISFAPERRYEDKERKVTVIDEMCTAQWWWETQGRLPPGATIAPLILSSDKTMLSNFRGDNSAWPVYLTIGNIDKTTRREVSSHATILLGYLPIPKFDCFRNHTRSLAKYRLFHHCMEIITASLVEAGTSGVEMACADGFIRDVWPILAAYVADYPEQCLVACCMENRCPICTVEPNARGDHVPAPKRDAPETLSFIRSKSLGQNDAEFKSRGIRPIPLPFWRNLPHSDIFLAFTPDLLHQIHKGVFKDHLVKWCTEILGKDEVDERFRTMPSHHGLRHFKSGISHVSQWTGTEHKEMERVFLGIVATGKPNAQLVTAARALLDFIYLASLQRHSAESLLALRDALDTFHAHKQIFIELRGRSPEHFNIPKLHALDHYEALIRRFGSADGFNTESPERLHIDFAKNAYRASNRKDYIQQMTKWLERQEAVDRYTAYLEWQAARQRPDTESQSAEDIVQDEGLPSYTLAKRPPPTSHSVLASYIASSEGHAAARFLPAITTFLQTQNSDYTPHNFDVFGLWKQVVIRLPVIPEVGSWHTLNLVRACGPVTETFSGNGRRRAQEPARLDYALVWTAEENTLTAGTSLEGLRVAQVKAIFQLPSYYPVSVKEPLAYVEWFTPFRTPDPTTGYYHISRSTRRKRGIDGAYAEIITVDRIARNVMLQEKNDRQYFVNSHIDGHTFAMFKLGMRNCLPGASCRNSGVDSGGRGAS